MPPAQHDTPVTRIGDDGRYIHRLRQSWVNTYMDCPERARLEMVGGIVRVENDAACVGTALHGAIEHAIHYLDEDGLMLPASDVVELFNEEWDGLLRDLDIKFIKRNPDKARAYGIKCALSFANSVLPDLNPYACEVPFGPYVIYEDDVRVLEITGTIDYLDQIYGMVDWKTAGREYTRWEKKRWSIQPTFYGAGLRHLVADGGLKGYNGPLTDWFYCVFVDNKDPEPQWVQVGRDSTWDGWLVDQMLGIAYQLEAHHIGRTPAWVKRDQHALCSPKWCPAWDRCKGAHVKLP